MAIKDQLLIIGKGITEWNKWRANNTITPDLSGAKLSEANLRGANLSGANLSGANLMRADMRRSNLMRADIRMANLSGVDLSGADLSGTKLSEADMREARLRGAKLHEANLIWAKLMWADLSGAKLRNADMRGAKLSEAKLMWADLSKADLSKADLGGANLSGAKLSGAKLSEADMRGTKLSGVDLTGADMSGLNLSEDNLSGADMRGARLRGANLSGADLRKAKLIGADLVGAQLVNTKIESVLFTNCRIYGISAWEPKGKPKDQSNLIITKDGEPEITVDNLEVAQFIYLLLKSPKIRDVIDTISKKAVLILGRFSEQQKPVLEAIRDELKKYDYLPIIFDWDRPASRNLVETVSTLAHLSRFVIADITDAKSIPAELMSIVPALPSVAVQPVMRSSDYEYALFDYIKSFRSVLEVYLYDTPEMLLANFKSCVIDPAETKAKSLVPGTEWTKNQ